MIKESNTPTLFTDRLILRKFIEQDMEALFLLLKQLHSPTLSQKDNGQINGKDRRANQRSRCTARFMRRR